MLMGIPPILGPDLLAALRVMGHGDEIAIVDGNYPALEQARRLVRADGHGLVALLDAVLCLLPLDRDVADPVLRTGWRNDPALVTPLHLEIEAVVSRRAPGRGVRALAGAAFYERVRTCHVVVASSEPQLYANVILRKGTIAPPEPDVISRQG